MNRDITFCDLESCKRHTTCHRYEPKPELGDSVFMWPDDFDPDNCEMYWPTKYGDSRDNPRWKKAVEESTARLDSIDKELIIK